MASEIDAEFPCSIELSIPFPTHRLATISMRAISVDKELSALVRRTFDVLPPTTDGHAEGESSSIMLVRYRATTNRMLRVAVNSFLDSLAFNIEVMASLDEDVLAAAAYE